jgi:hypothetical protein
MKRKRTMKRQDAIEILFEETPADYILEDFETPEFFEFYVSAGGDALKYRIYKKTGEVYER